MEDDPLWRLVTQNAPWVQLSANITSNRAERVVRKLARNVGEKSAQNTFANKVRIITAGSLLQLESEEDFG